MNQVFMITGAVSAQPSSCHVESKKQGLDKLVLEEKQLDLTHQSAQQQVARLEAARVITKWHLKNLALFCAASSAFIEAVSFIPKHPETSQVLFARRGKMGEKDGFISPLGFYDGDYASQIIPLLDAEAIPEATKDIDASFVQEVRKVLGFFLKDQETRAIALTFPHLQGRVTLIWTKI